MLFVISVFFSAQFCDQGREESSISNGTHAVNGRASVSGPEDPHEEGSSVCVCVCIEMSDVLLC